IMLTQDELASFVVRAVRSPGQVPAAAADVVLAFPEEGNQRTVSLRRTDSAAPTDPVPVVFHGEGDGSWKRGHLPLGGAGGGSGSGVGAEGGGAAARALREDGVSSAAGTAWRGAGSEASARGLRRLSAQLDAQGADVLPGGPPVRPYVAIEGG